MAILTTRVQVGDYDAWKPMFDTDPAGVREKSTGLRLFRLVEDPDEVLVAVEFATADDAAEAREKLLASGVLERVTVVTEPALAIEA
ncbi:MAG TPA: hypothetical protein VMY78_06230 [Solirubrobacteraceae bacterium]|nr:hypothetical protein [Solirubrobacteraceae bacterium]